MTREEIIDEAVRRIKGDHRWRLDEGTLAIFVTPPYACCEGESLMPLIRHAFNRVAGEAAC